MTKTLSELIVEAAYTGQEPENIVELTDISAAELDVLDGVTPGTATASKAVVLDANKDIATLRDVTMRDLTAEDIVMSGDLTTTQNVGTANTGVTAVEYGNGVQHVTVLTVSQVDALTLDDDAALADGYLLYTFPAGVIVVNNAYMSMAITAGSSDLQADTPDVGLGTLEGSDAQATLDADDAACENIITGQTAADANGTATVATIGGVSLAITAAADHTVFFNAAATWSDDEQTDLTADIAGTVVLEWTLLA